MFKRGRTSNAVVGTPSSDARNSTSRHIVHKKIVINSVAMGISTKSIELCPGKSKAVAEEECKY